MTTQRVQPYLVPAGETLDQHMHRLRLNTARVAVLAGDASDTTVGNWRKGRARMSTKAATRLAAEFGIDPKQLRPDKPGETPSTAKPAPPLVQGPAEQAAALGVGMDVLKPVRGVQGASRAPHAVDGFGMEVSADGVTRLWLRATLPYARGAALFRMLLDFGLVATTATEDDRGG